MHRSLLASLALAPLLTLGSACGKDDAREEAVPPAAETASPSESGGGADVCALVSPAQLESTLGIEAQGMPASNGFVDMCTWMTTKGHGVVVTVARSKRYYEEAYQAIERQAGEGPEGVSGVGEKAFTHSISAGRLGQAFVYAVTDSKSVGVQVVGRNEEASALKDQALAIAKIVVAGL